MSWFFAETVLLAVLQVQKKRFDRWVALDMLDWSLQKTYQSQNEHSEKRFLKASGSSLQLHPEDKMMILKNQEPVKLDQSPAALGHHALREQNLLKPEHQVSQALKRDFLSNASSWKRAVRLAMKAPIEPVGI